ncbi:MAG: RNA polymerase sigma factor [Planctomycetales bacterium]|nr:RNA polymerase sigma factor [Planctomycetales bacterium]
MTDTQPSKPETSEGTDEPMTHALFAARYREIYPRLWLIASGITGDRTQAEDLVQEAAVIGLSKLDQFRHGSNFAAWLSEIVRFCSLNYARRTRNRATLAADPYVLDQSQGREDSAESASYQEVGHLNVNIDADQLGFDDDVLSALHSIGEVPRCCLLLRTIQQLSYAEIATAMGIPEGTAMSHVHRARGAMRKHIEERLRSKSGRSPR